ncbi:30S ribosomal protein S7 [Candidatus Roizmanbacteria bacterium RIFCSPHIGHO2_01_FULL_35_10]|uniref:Small ribosomal subunit protein uS7 n=1 Tax=Candidatus Roizmanbacteria bacterium RIFCSPLOWO2_01_FULL_35_13 TaxID=1802055 RepID=A0A1F7IF16_9BACT|nr:MAG: 30S ribosomal protein S7 [Candidatus Roizmanbacteria bacterium RIFCSPHIGHO2_01_FULL_35_10]OGK41947.1 MAG: 30S ribosomal protein S7 [Candidatus Roizmanbacteria bacterium RIFCSPLOWO2_01_FULL_35_13]
MPRRPYKKLKTKIDPIFGNIEVAKLINYTMVDGKKSIARSIIYTIFDKLSKEKQDPLRILHQAIQHVSPNYEVKSRRLGGASYLVPIEVRKNRRLFLALNWILIAAKSRSNKEYNTFSDKLMAELIDAAKNQGQAVNKKLQVEKLADANKAFAHLKW